ncbi:outer membrane beta-barrel protein [Kiritimatiellaeota bacterium B1221]|nr:outer membrane beta-barrel protein [Kiritimatiellaeota bacterium B1221]
MKKTLFTLGLTAALSVTQLLQAETLLGKNYVRGSLGVTLFGDDFLSDTYGEGFDFDVLTNVNLGQNLDLRLDFDYKWADADIAGGTSDLSQSSVGADLIYYTSPGEAVNPYLNAGLGVVYTDYTVKQAGLTFELDSTEASYNLGFGVEFETSDLSVTRAGFEYLTYDSVDIYNLIAMYGYSFSEKSLGAVRAEYDVESEDFEILLSYIFKM